MFIYKSLFGENNNNNTLTALLRLSLVLIVKLNAFKAYHGFVTQWEPD